MFPGLGLLIIALLVIPVLLGISAAIVLLFIPRLRFLAPYSAFVPLFAESGLVGGLMGGLRLAHPYFYRYDYGLTTTVWPAWVITLVFAATGTAAGVALALLASLRINRARQQFAAKPV